MDEYSVCDKPELTAGYDDNKGDADKVLIAEAKMIN